MMKILNVKLTKLLKITVYKGEKDRFYSLRVNDLTERMLLNVTLSNVDKVNKKEKKKEDVKHTFQRLLSCCHFFKV